MMDRDALIDSLLRAMDRALQVAHEVGGTEADLATFHALMDQLLSILGVS